MSKLITKALCDALLLHSVVSASLYATMVFLSYRYHCRWFFFNDATCYCFPEIGAISVFVSVFRHSVLCNMFWLVLWMFRQFQDKWVLLNFWICKFRGKWIVVTESHWSGSMDSEHGSEPRWFGVMLVYLGGPFLVFSFFSFKPSVNFRRFVMFFWVFFICVSRLYFLLWFASYHLSELLWLSMLLRLVLFLVHYYVSVLLSFWTCKGTRSQFPDFFYMS